MILTMQKHANLFGGISGCFWAMMEAQRAPDVRYGILCVGGGRLMRRGGYMYELRPLQHDFSHPEPCKVN